MITDRASLRTAVFAYAQQGQIEANFDLLLSMAEARMQSDIKTRRIEASIYGTLNSPILPIPEDVAQYQRLVLYEVGTQRERSLEYAPPGVNEKLTGAPGRPESYTVIDQAFIIYPSPSTNCEYALYYIPQIRPLTDDEPTNDVLKRAPNVYLYACLAEGHTLIKDHPQADKYLSLYDNAWRNFRSAENSTKYPTNTPLRVRMRKAVN